MAFTHTQLFKDLCFPALLLGTCLLVGQALAQGKHAGLEITVDNIEEAKGTLIFAVFDNADFWLSSKADEPPYAAPSAPVKSTEAVTVLIEDLPAGEYGISVFQDINDNGKLDTNLVGYPKEPYGFSAPMRKFGPPKFKKAAIPVRDEDVAITIQLQ